MNFNTLILKVASRCNLNCTYCYMYNMGDNSYLLQPKFMSIGTIKAIINEVKIYCEKNNIKTFTFSFHGGEPLLAEKSLYKTFINYANSQLECKVNVNYNLQTNGVLLDDEWCKLFLDLKIVVNVSIDGIEEDHNKNRIYHNGKGSFKDVLQGLETAVKFGYTRIINVINIDSDPIRLYEFYKSKGVKRVELLLPDRNYNNSTYTFGQTAYADWLIKLYKYWRDDGKDKPTIGYFYNIIQYILGKKEYATELFGKIRNNIIVIETDGGIETSDPVKICGNNFTKLGLNINRNNFEEAFEKELIKLYYNSHFNLCQTCIKCPISDICAGGFLPHRYSPSNKFDNPSIYCYDLAKLITYIQNDIVSIIPKDIIDKQEIELITFEEVIDSINKSL